MPIREQTFLKCDTKNEMLPFLYFIVVFALHETTTEFHVGNVLELFVRCFILSFRSFSKQTGGGGLEQGGLALTTVIIEGSCSFG